MSDQDDLVASALALVDGRKTCDNCWFGIDGSCAIRSCSCVTAVRNKDPNPPRWLSYVETVSALQSYKE